MTQAVGTTRVLNMVLLAAALGTRRFPLSIGDLRDAVEQCVKPQFVALNLAAIDEMTQQAAPLE